MTIGESDRRKAVKKDAILGVGRGTNGRAARSVKRFFVLLLTDLFLPRGSSCIMSRPRQTNAFVTAPLPAGRIGVAWIFHGAAGAAS